MNPRPGRVGVAFRARTSSAATHRDPLTGLPDRAHLLRTLRGSLADPPSRHTWLGVLYLDLDGFKQVNDTAGHAAGDAVLVDVATRLTRHLSKDDLLARIGGDEFVVLVRRRTQADDVLSMATSLATALLEGTRGADGEALLSCPASVGVALLGPRLGDGTGHDAPSDGRPERIAEALLRRADLALMAAKRRGMGQVELFRHELLDQAWDAVDLGTRLRRALGEQPFELRYQPVIDVRSARCVRVEALLRLLAPDGSLVAPGELVAAAENAGRLHEVTAWVVDRALADQAVWSREPPTRGVGAGVSVNVPAAHLADPAAVAHLVRTARRHPAGTLLVEVHRSPRSHRLDQVLTGRCLLRRAGVHVVLEDVDRDWSLADLTALRPDAVTVGTGLAAGGAAEQAALTSLVRVCDAIEAPVTAKGIESAAAAAEMVGLGVHAAQGLAVAPVVDASRVGQAVAEGSCVLTGWWTGRLTMQDTTDTELTPAADLGTVGACSTAFSYADRASAETQRARDPSSPSGPGGFSRPSSPDEPAEES